MPENPYDQIPYITYPQPQTHPDRLAAVGKLFGMDPAPVDGCRVLEIGCGALVIPEQIAVPRADQAFDEMDNLHDEQLAAMLKAVARALVDMARDYTSADLARTVA